MHILTSLQFGGKLVSFENIKGQTPHQPGQRQISLSQVVTETDLLSGSLQLEQALSNGQHMEFCAMKAANCSDRMQENIWNFLMVRTNYFQQFNAALLG